MSDKKQKMPIVDDPTASEVYSNKVVGIMFDGGAYVITLGSQRLIPAGTEEKLKDGQGPKVYVNYRLALSPAAAVELINQLSGLMGHISQTQQAEKDAAHSTSH